MELCVTQMVVYVCQWWMYDDDVWCVCRMSVPCAKRGGRDQSSPPWACRAQTACGAARRGGTENKQQRVTSSRWVPLKDENTTFYTVHMVWWHRHGVGECLRCFKMPEMWFWDESLGFYRFRKVHVRGFLTAHFGLLRQAASGKVTSNRGFSVTPFEIYERS